MVFYCNVAVTITTHQNFMEKNYKYILKLNQIFDSSVFIQTKTYCKYEKLNTSPDGAFFFYWK